MFKQYIENRYYSFLKFGAFCAIYTDKILSFYHLHQLVQSVEHETLGVTCNITLGVTCILAAPGFLVLT